MSDDFKSDFGIMKERLLKTVQLLKDEVASAMEIIAKAKEERGFVSTEGKIFLMIQKAVGKKLDGVKLCETDFNKMRTYTENLLEEIVEGSKEDDIDVDLLNTIVEMFIDSLELTVYKAKEACDEK